MQDLISLVYFLIMLTHVSWFTRTKIAEFKDRKKDSMNYLSIHAVVVGNEGISIIHDDRTTWIITISVCDIFLFHDWSVKCFYMELPQFIETKMIHLFLMENIFLRHKHLVCLTKIFWDVIWTINCFWCGRHFCGRWFNIR